MGKTDPVSCIFCNAERTSTSATYKTKKGVRRHKACRKCGGTFMTLEDANGVQQVTGNLLKKDVPERFFKAHKRGYITANEAASLAFVKAQTFREQFKKWEEERK